MIIAIDYDGTIADTNREKTQWIEAQLGKTVLPWLCNRTDCVPIIGLEAYEKMGTAVYEKKGTLVAKPVPGAVDALHQLVAMGALLHLVTARPPRRLAYARQWLADNGVLACFNKLHSSAGASKAVVCKSIGADILIDDDIRHLQGISTDSLRRILLQEGRDDPPACGAGITFCSGWQAVIRFCTF